MGISTYLHSWSEKILSFIMENKILFFGLLFIGLIAYAHSVEPTMPDDKTIEEMINKALKMINGLGIADCNNFPGTLNEFNKNCFTCKDKKWSFKGMDCIRNGGNGAESTCFNYVLFLATAAISLFLGGRFWR